MLTDDEKMQMYLNIFDLASYLIEDGKAADDRRRFSLAYSADDPNVAAIYLLKQENRLLSERIRKQAEKLKNPRGEPVQREKEEVICEDSKKVSVNSLIKSEKGEELMKRKYGQGCIVLKTRKRKDNTIYKIYEGRYYNEYGKIKSVYGKTQKECAKLLNEAIKYKKTPERRKSITVSEWILLWYNSFKRESLRPSTRRNYEIDINVYILPSLGKEKLYNLTGEKLQTFFNGIENGNTRKKVYNLLCASLEKAVILKRIAWNPCKAVELPKYKKVKKRAFTYEEQELILSKAAPKIAQVFFFLCATGLRVGEFLALRESDFFFEEHYFKVDKAIVNGIEGDPKTESSNRIVYFTDELLKQFDLSLLGTFTYAGLRTAFRRLLEEIKLKNVSLHSTRHTFATVCYALGMNEKSLQSLLGHSTLAMTQDTYTHLMKRGSSVIRSYLAGLCAFVRTTI